VKKNNRSIDFEKRFSNKFPELLKEWHKTKNHPLTPYDVSYGSDIKVWWICKNNHEYISKISSRSMGKGCPYCVGKRISEDNNLLKNRPDLCEEWDYAKNKLLPQDVTVYSNKKVWWTCRNKHSYDCVIANRSKLNRACPYCAGRKATIENCLETKSPILCGEWDYFKNKCVTPKNVVSNTIKKVWWICSLGHEWKESVNNRYNHPESGCPFCSKIILKNGAVLDSIPEAIKYIEYKNKKIKFKHNKKYGRGMGKSKYDFYFPLENKYVEVTSYNKVFRGYPGRYFKYLRKIVEKRKFVENVLNAKFEFIQLCPTRKQVEEVRKRIKTYDYAKEQKGK